MTNPLDIGSIRRLMKDKAEIAVRRAAGGARGRNGVDFEDDYAARRLVDLAVEETRKAGTGEEVYICGGIVTFVDDLYVFDGEGHIFSQAKRGRISEAIFEEAIVPAFEDQRNLALAVQAECRRASSPEPQVIIELVVSSEAAATRARVHLKGTACRITVQPPLDLRAGPSNGTTMHEKLEKLCSIHRRGPGPRIILEQLANAWHVLKREGTIYEFVMHAAERSHGFLQTLGPDYQMPDRAKDVLENAVGFSFEIVGRNFYYKLEGSAWFSSPRVLCGSPEWNTFESQLAPSDDALQLFAKLAVL